MIYGQPWGSGYGEPDRMIDFLDVSLRTGGTSVNVSFSPATDFGDSWWGVYIGCSLADFVYISSDTDTVSRVYPLPPARADNSVIVLRLGQAQMDCKRAAQVLDGLDARQITAFWSWPIELLPLLDSSGVVWGHDSAWSISGLTYALLSPEERITRRQVAVDISVVAGNATITLSAGGNTLCSGTVAIPGTATLAAVGDSGVSGTVAIDGSAMSAAGATLGIRYPATMGIYIATANPPTTLSGTVVFNGADRAGYTSPAKAAGTWYTAILPTSDTGVTGTKSTATAATIGAPPLPSTGLRYTSGAAAATIVSWDYTTPAGISFNVYVQKIGDTFMDVTNPAVTVVGLKTATLPAQTGYPGIIRVLVRASLAGAEEKNGEYIEVEYDSGGVRISPRPNTPSISTVGLAGATLTVLGLYAPAGEAGAATALQAFLRTSGGSYDFTSPDSTAALTGSAPLKTASISVVAISSGWHYFTLKAATAAGIQSADYAPEQAIYVETAASAAPAAPDVTVSRG